MRGVPIDFTDHPVLKRVYFAACANLVVVVLVLLTGIGSSATRDAEHTLFMRGNGRYLRPGVDRYFKTSLIFFIGTTFYAVARARRR